VTDDEAGLTQALTLSRETGEGNAIGLRSGVQFARNILAGQGRKQVGMRRHGHANSLGTNQEQVKKKIDLSIAY
jgi:hypothetical protein